MTWSTPIAEPLGAIVGVAAGELASLASNRVSKALKINEQTAELLTTTSAHFAASVATKAAVNCACADPIGLGINPVTATCTSTVHGVARAYGVPAVKNALQGESEKPALNPG
jgi:hypothetical protein